MEHSAVKVEEILAQLGIQKADSVRPVYGGLETLIWKVAVNGQAHALRLFRPDEQGRSDLEAAAMAAAGAAGIPVPAVHGRTQWQGHPVMLIAWIPGQVILEEILARPWAAWRIARAFGRVHARLNHVAAPALIQERRSNWREWAGPIRDEALNSALDRIPMRSDALLHLDYHPYNVMMERGKITGVIDWSNVHAGDPRADVARTVTVLRLSPMPGRFRQTLMDPFRRLLAAGWLNGYTREAGPLRDMAPFYAWAGTAMQHEWTPRLHRPGFWLKEEHLEPVKRWTACWRKEAGIQE